MEFGYDTYVTQSTTNQDVGVGVAHMAFTPSFA